MLIFYRIFPLDSDDPIDLPHVQILRINFWTPVVVVSCIYDKNTKWSRCTDTILDILQDEILRKKNRWELISVMWNKFCLQC